jgi:amino acid adenylation domain-containing protein/non-ribosomal peptide synthase protein (TIGR01720 family)
MADRMMIDAPSVKKFELQRLLQKTSICFDVSVWELFLGIVTGATQVLLPPGAEKEPSFLLEFITKYNITSAHFVPSMMVAFVSVNEDAISEADGILTQVIASGEGLTTSVSSRLQHYLPSARIINYYGPTEASIDVSHCVFDDTDHHMKSVGRVPIGRPIWNICLYVLNDNMDICPPGVPGELHISGVGLARGYFGRPSLTADRFVPNPFATNPNYSRMYKTGDLCKYLPNGIIDCIGRIDFQVKIRGFRIELGEIEYALTKIDGVNESIVLARDIMGQKKLVAYLTWSADAVPLSVAALRAHLANEVLQHMIPSHFVIMDKFPLSLNGKADRAALPMPDLGTVVAELEYQAPSNSTETILVGIFADILGVPRVGVNDNFFELGGDSITSIRIASRAQDSGLSLSVKLIFEHQTVASIAKNIPKGNDSIAVRIVDLHFPTLDTLPANIVAQLDVGNVEDLFPLSPLQEGMLFHSVMESGSEVYISQVNWTFPITADGSFDAALFRRSWSSLVKRHPALRTRFLWEGLAQPLQVVLRESGLEWIEFDRSSVDATNAIVKEIMADERRKPFSLKAPAMRFIMTRFNSTWEFVWTYHHIYLDGWSYALIESELASLYGAGSDHTAAPAPSFRRYVEWLGSQPENIAEKHWKRVLSGFRDATPLPGSQNKIADKKRINKQAIARKTANLPGILAFSHSHKTTLNTIIQAAWSYVLSRHSNVDDVVFGAVVSGRASATTVEDIEKLVGLCINTLPVRIDVRPHQSIANWLRSIQLQFAESTHFEYTPLVSIQAWTELPKGAQLFESIIALENYPVEKPDDSSLPIMVRQAVGYTSVALSVLVRASSAGEFTIEIEHDEHRVSPSVVSSLLEQFAHVLAQIATANVVGDIDVSSSSSFESQELVQTEITTLSQKIEQRSTEDQTGIIDHTDSTYSITEINSRANKLGRYLQSLGVIRATVVGVVASVQFPSFEAIAALAVVKLGAVVVNIDPSHPQTRVDTIIEDANIELIVGINSSSPLSFGLPYLDVTAHWKSIAALDASDIRVESHHLAPVAVVHNGRWEIGQPGLVVSNADIILHRAAGDLLTFKKSSPVHSLAGMSVGTLADSEVAKEQVELDIILGSLSTRQLSPSSSLEVLDSHSRAVPNGVAGQVYAALHASYPTKWSSSSYGLPSNHSRLLFPTGELRRLSSSLLEPAGRVDGQVQVSSTVSANLKEIEHILNAHPEVSEVVALAKDGSVFAFVKRNASAQVSVTDLQRHLAALLPPSSVPAAIFMLDKIDRGSLPDPAALLLGGSRSASTANSEDLDAPRTPSEAALCEIWRNALGVPRVGIHDNFYELGGDSIISIQIVSMAKQRGIKVTVRQVLGLKTVAHLAAEAGIVGTSDTAAADQRLVIGQFQSTPILQWFHEAKLSHANQYNQEYLFRIPGNTTHTIAASAIRALHLHHDGMRLRKSDGEMTSWRIEAASIVDLVPIKHLDGSAMTSEEQLVDLLREAAQIGQRSLNLSEGPVSYGIHLSTTLGTDFILLIVHHVAVDGVSWRILQEDLASSIAQLSRGEPVSFPAKTSSLLQWSEQLRNYASQESTTSELKFWIQTLGKAARSIKKPGQAVALTYERITVQTSTLPADDASALLTKLCAAFHADVNDVLLTALALTLLKLQGATNTSETVTFTLEGHGREEIIDSVDISRTVGWFTTMFPVALTLKGVDWRHDVSSALKCVKEQLRRIPNRGAGYGVLKYLNSRTSKSLRDMQPRENIAGEVLFNYLGQIGGAPSVLDAAVGDSIHANERFDRLIVVDGYLNAEGSLIFNWKLASENIKFDVSSVPQMFIESLKSMVNVINVNPEAGSYTPSDFPLASHIFDQTQLQVLVPNHKTVEDIFPLTPMQEGMLFEWMLDSKSGLYVNQVKLLIEDPTFDSTLFKKSWNELIKRHAVLRTRFAWDGLTEPIQIVDRNVEIPWFEHFVQLGKAHEEAEKILTEVRFAGFDIRRSPLMRFDVIHDGKETVFVWAFHHIYLDGWSVAIVWNEVMALYQTKCNAALLQQNEPLWRSYIGWLKKQNVALAEQYWRTRLAGFSAVTPLPNTVSSHSSRVIHQISSVLPANEVTLIHSYAKSNRTTVSNLLNAAWAMILHTFSRERDVVFGSTVSGRATSEVDSIEQMVGLFINSLPIRAVVHSEQPIRTLLEDLQQQQMEANQFQWTSLVQVQSWSDLPRGTSIFDTLLVHVNYPVSAPANEALPFIVKSMDTLESPSLPLTIVVSPTEANTLEFTWMHDTGRYNEATINRLFSCFREALLSIANAKPTDIIATLSLTSSAEVNSIASWNDTDEIYDVSTIHQMFADQLTESPDSIVAAYEDEQITYAELDRRSNMLSNFIIELGVRPGSYISVCMHRSIELLVSFLAIFKSGCAYVPIDPAFPAGRQDYMLEDSRSVVLLTQSALARAGLATPTIFVDTMFAEIAQRPASDPKVSIIPSALACILYTSGSTGKPKGCMLTHEGIVCRLQDHRRKHNLSRGDRGLMRTSICFDLSLWELFLPMMTGWTTVFLPAHQEREMSVIVGTLSAFNLTALNLVPSMLDAFFRYGDLETELYHIKKVFVAGEAIPENIMPFFSSGFWSDKLVNGYGPTEATYICTTWYSTESKYSRSVSTGLPVSSMKVYLCTDDFELVPVGAPGELCTGGVGLVAGYLNRPALTADKFVPNPFDSKHKDNRLYKTGDLCKYAPNGNLDYVGRIDFQVRALLL